MRPGLRRRLGRTDLFEIVTQIDSLAFIALSDSQQDLCMQLNTPTAAQIQAPRWEIALDPSMRDKCVKSDVECWCSDTERLRSGGFST